MNISSTDSAVSLDGGFKKFGMNLINKKSPLVERQYYHLLLGAAYDKDGYFKSLTTGDGAFGKFGPRTKAATLNLQYELGLESTGLPNPATIFGAELARRNNAAVNINVKTVTKIFEQIKKPENALKFALDYLEALDKNNNKAKEAISEVPLGKRQQKIAAGIENMPDEDPVKKAPYGHLFIMANAGISLKDYSKVLPEIQRKAGIASEVVPGFGEMRQYEKDAVVCLIYGIEEKYLVDINGKPSVKIFRNEFPKFCKALDDGDFRQAADEIIAGDEFTLKMTGTI